MCTDLPHPQMNFAQAPWCFFYSAPAVGHPGRVLPSLRVDAHRCPRAFRPCLSFRPFRRRQGPHPFTSILADLPAMSDTGEKADHTSSLEKGVVHDYVTTQTDSRYHFDAADLDRVQRRLKQRHIQMIAVSIARPALVTALCALSPSPTQAAACRSCSLGLRSSTPSHDTYILRPFLSLPRILLLTSHRLLARSVLVCSWVPAIRFKPQVLSVHSSPTASWVRPRTLPCARSAR